MAERIELLQAYIRRYPNGYFSELAQLELDQELARQGKRKVLPAPLEDNPYSKGSVTRDINYKVGDSYTMRVMDPLSMAVQSTYTSTNARISDREVHFSSGVIFNLLGDPVALADGRRFSDAQVNPYELSVGHRWTTRFTVTFRDGNAGRLEFECRIAARESVTAPAGTFNAFRVDRRGTYSTSTQSGSTQIESTSWVAPEIRVTVVDTRVTRSRGAVTSGIRLELVAYKQA